jgi:outer membrane protein OmpA-like peptidoglycan-associated protein
MSNRSRSVSFIALAFALLLAGSSFAGAQAPSSNVSIRQVSANQNAKVRGVVLSRSADSFVVREDSGTDVTVVLTDATSVKSKGGFFSRGKNYGVTSILRGLTLEAEGRGNDAGELVASKIRFGDSDLRVARSIDTRVDPVEQRVGGAETRLSDVEANAQRLSGQIDELVAVSNAARGGAKAAQETADAAVAGVNATNERISALDDYQVQETSSILFRVNSAVLSPDAKAQLDTIATKALAAKGYVIEIAGFTDSTGGIQRNRMLSQRRADAVVRYLAEEHRVPLRRIVTPFGYGESQAVADNTTRSGREQNRRVEVKILVSRGLVQPVQPITTPSSSGATSMLLR